MHDEEAAIAEIRNLSENARLHLSHVMRHQAVEVFRRLQERRRLLDEQSRCLYDFEQEIERMGL